MTMRRVVIPVDGTDFSHQVLPFVQSFLDPAQTELVLLKVVTREPTGVSAMAEPLRAGNAFDVRPSQEVDEHWLSRRFIYASQEWDGAIAEVKALLSPMVTELKQAGFQVKVEVQFAHDVAQAIVNFVSVQSADMIAMATHGRKGLSRMVRGSVAEDVLRHVTVPVVLMHPAETA